MKNLKTAFFSLITIFVFAWGGKYLFENYHRLKDIKGITLTHCIAVLLLFSVFFLINASILKLALSKYQIKMGIFEAWGLSFFSSLLNYLTPMKGGTGFKFLYIKKKYNLDISHNISIFLIVSCFVLFTSALWGGVVTCLFSSRNPMFIHVFNFLALIVLALLICYFIARRLKFKLPVIGKLANKLLNNLFKGFSLIDWNFSIKFFILLSIQIVIWAGIFRIIFMGLEINAGFESCLIIAVFSNLALATTLTPGNIGIKEFLFILLFRVFGVTEMEILTVLLVERAAQLFIIFFFSIFFYIYMVKTGLKLKDTK